MKRRIIMLLLTTSMIATLLSGCGNSASEKTAEQSTTEIEVEAPEQTETATLAPEATEEPAPEATEEPAPEATEEPAPEATEEPAPETTEEPAPETTEEPILEPQVMYTYTYTDCEAVKYAQQTVNVRDLPSTDGNKVGSLSTNQEVKVTGQCNETSWYRIDYNGSVAYVSNKYLGDNKVEVQQSTNSGGSGSGNSGGSTASAVPNPYELPLQTWVDLGDWMLYIHPANESPDPCVNSAFWENQRATLQARYPGSNISGRIGIWLDNGTWSAWMIAVGGTNSYDYPKPLLDFIVKYQY